MGWFKSVATTISHAGSTIESGVKSGVTTVVDGATSVGNTVVSGVTSEVNAAGQAIETVGTTVGNVTVAGTSEVVTGVTSAANTLESGASQEFGAAVKAGEAAFDKVKHELEIALAEGEVKILGPAAEHIVKDLRDAINGARSAWSSANSMLSTDVAILKGAAISKQITPPAEEAFSRIAKHMGAALGPFFSKSYVSFGVEFGVSAVLGVGVEAALGVIAGLPNITDIHGYGAVGVSVGAEAGAEADVALVFNTSGPLDSGGPSLNVIVSLEAEVGGTVVVSFNLPDFSLGGISIGLGAGDEAGISIGGGYTYVF